MTRSVIIYGDGSCLGNPGPGGWAIHVIDGSHRHDFCGGAQQSTNNRMELVALIKALSWSAQNLQSGDQVEIRLDNQNALNTAFQWLPGWKKKGWRKADGSPVLNVDLVQQVDAVLQKVSAAGIMARGSWVKGHSGEKNNEHVDRLAHGEATAWQQGSGVVERLVASTAPVDTAPVHTASKAPEQEEPRSLIRLRRGLAGHQGCFDLARWSGAALVARRGGDGRWHVDLPLATPCFSDDMVAAVAPLPADAAQADGDLAMEP